MKKNWRIKYIIETEAVLQLGTINFKNSTVVNVLDCNYFGLNENSRVIEIILKSEVANTIEDAYITGLDTIEELLDRFCLISYSKAVIRTLLSVTKEKVKPNEEFYLIQNIFTITRDLNTVNLDELMFETSETNQKYIRLLRFGINSNSSEDKLLKHFSLIEQIAENESTETIKVKCQNCGNDTDTGRKKTNKFIGDVLLKYNINEKETKKITSYRGKIAHGGGKRNQDYFLDVDIFSAKLEAPVFTEITERLNTKLKNGKNAHLPGYPLNKFLYKYDNDGKLIFIRSEWKSQGLFSILDKDTSDEVSFGVPTVIPDTYILPDLEK
ncbi:hypothetical protein [Flavobacterium sp. XS2P14]|uniref:hypothetical protein n=1 Tax=Flavobacterium sp. XS2P14 TaxID=3401735 RepID=UPI003AADB845